MKNLAIIIVSFVMLGACQSTEWTLSSPDKNVKIIIKKDASLTDANAKQLFYSVTCQGTEVVLLSPLGIDREDEQFTKNLSFVKASPVTLIDEKYTLKSGKQLECHNYANEMTLEFKNANNAKVQLIVRAYNDGVAFRYYFPGKSETLYKVVKEHTAFAMPLNGKAFIHPYHHNSRLKPSYETYSENDIAIGTDSPNPWGWQYPMLFNVNDMWVMITEATKDGSYCGTHIHSTKDGVYSVVFAEKDEIVLADDDPEPTNTLPWATPWRVIIASNLLSDIVETMIVQNLNPPNALVDDSWVRPGRASWSWWYEGGSPRDYKRLIEYVDFTAEMTWEYMLIDAGWPRMTGGTMEDVVAYANTKGVGVWLWYHCGAGQEITPSNLMSHPEARKAEFKRIQQLGVKGVKIDFFDTDKQGVMKLYEEMLKDAAECHILINFHGASLPRGLERTYPNLLTTEAVRGAEAWGNQNACNMAPWHNATLPFTRNVVGAMDYTPVTFTNKRETAIHLTTWAHQLAQSVVFESGIQNFADRAEAYLDLPPAPKTFLKKVPVAWDETRLVAGYPGDFVVIARRSGKTWYIGCVNGKNEARTIEFELPFAAPCKELQLITDGADAKSFAEATAPTNRKISVNVLPYGGFVGTCGM